MTIQDDDAARNVLEPLRPDDAELAFRDGLTGLYNYRLLEQILEERWDELLGLVDRFAIVILDLDLFKEVNDRYGHLSGDEVLRATGKILHRAFRAGDLVFRYGGDEFVVLLPGAESAEAMALGERARAAMLEAEFFAPEEERRIEIPVSFSIGVASYPSDGESGKAVLSRADERLYLEKQILRQRVMRRRVAVTAAALTVVAALAVAVVLVFSSRAPAPVTAPPMPASSTLPVVSTTAGNEETLLLGRIAEMQEEIERLTRAKQEQAAPDAQKSSQEIAALEARVRELNTRLEARTAVSSPQTVEPARPSGDIATPDSHPAPVATDSRPAAQPPNSSTARGEAPTVVQPRLLEPITPRYPEMARERRVEANVEFSVLVDETGRVVNATPLGPPKGLGFDEAARTAALSSRWKPATRDGAAVPMETRLVVQFRIAGKGD